MDSYGHIWSHVQVTGAWKLGSCSPTEVSLVMQYCSGGTLESAIRSQGAFVESTFQAPCPANRTSAGGLTFSRPQRRDEHASTGPAQVQLLHTVGSAAKHVALPPGS